MAVTVRLSRLGTSKAPYYRIVVADQRKKRDGRFIERIGTYDPRRTPEAIELDTARLEYWIGKGARPTETVQQIAKRLAARQPAATT